MADKVKCLPGSEVEAECDPAVLETVFMPDPVSCNFFAVCHAGLFVERRQCRAGLSFDPATLACADSETVVCVVSDFLANDLNIPRPPQIGKSVNKMRHPLQMPLFKKRFGLF